MSSASARAHEPSMEEILASIRRIIADDQESRPAQESRPPEGAVGAEIPPDQPYSPPAPALPEEPELEAAEVEPAAVAPDYADLDIALPEIMFADPGEEPSAPVAEAPPPRAADPVAPAPPREGLVSREATASIGDAFNLLSHTILQNNARTLEDLVREMLKPMLKVWLDDNLPPLVERLVRAEIERVARGR